jgi:hypothetical protein
VFIYKAFKWGVAPPLAGYLVWDQVVVPPEAGPPRLRSPKL